MLAYTRKLLIEICTRLQLQPSLYELANQRYQTISDTIQDDEVFKNIELRIYPQGSFRLKTTVKPIESNEYDLDFVVELPQNDRMMPQELYDHIYRILSTDGIHNSMMERKNRCVRVKYANDFHLDIMPGKAINRATNEIIVPDRELRNWYHHSNPIAFAEWFENQAKTQIRAIFERGKAYASAEPITDQELVVRLEPLRRAVQLIKRYRDIYCKRTKKEAVRSIVLCTLMGHISSEYSDEFSIMIDFCRYVNSLIKSAGGKPFTVRNPVADEVLTEKWQEDIQNYFDFVSMMKALSHDLNVLNSLDNNVEMIQQLQKMFGEKVTNSAVETVNSEFNKARLAGNLTVGDNGLINSGRPVATVKKNTFYGDEL